MIHAPGRHPERDRQQRPAHARSLPDGSEPGPRLCAERHRSARHQPASARSDALGGTKYWGASASCRCRSGSCRRKSGSRARSMPMPAGSTTTRDRRRGPLTNEVNVPGCIRRHANPPSIGTCTGLQYDNGNVVRTSVGVGLIWASPFGPLRFDYAVPLTKGAVRPRAGIQVWRRNIVLRRFQAKRTGSHEEDASRQRQTPVLIDQNRGSVRSPAGPRRVEWRSRHFSSNRLRRRWPISPR